LGLIFWVEILFLEVAIIPFREGISITIMGYSWTIEIQKFGAGLPKRRKLWIISILIK
jgi:hypothetical protein